MDESKLNLHDTVIPFPAIQRKRRSMLPWWVVASIWLFFAFAALIPFGVILGLLGYNFELSLFGLETHNPISVTGLILILIFILKGVTSFGLWTEKKWGVGLARIDAAISIVACSLVMGYSIFGLHVFSLRLELIILIPYFYKMNKLQYDWVNLNEEVLITPESTDVE